MVSDFHPGCVAFFPGRNLSWKLDSLCTKPTHAVIDFIGFIRQPLSHYFSCYFVYGRHYYPTADLGYDPCWTYWKSSTTSCIHARIGHYRHHDNLLKWLTIVAESFNWFNPMIYFAVRETGLQCELACDEAVTNGFSHDERIRYGKTFLAMASPSNHRPFTLSATMSEDKRNLKARLEVLKKIKRDGEKAVVFSIIIISMALVIAMVSLLVSCAKRPALAEKNSSTSASSSIEINSSSQQAPTQDGTTSSDVSIPTFKGTVVYGKLPLINIPSNKWEQAEQDFETEYPFLKSTMESVKSSDFQLTDNWQGTLDNEPFLLNVYSFQAQYLLVVSKYGNNPTKIKLFISSPKSVFAFYGDSVWLLQSVKGIGEPLNIISDDFEGVSPQTDNLDLEFEQLFTKLSAIEPEKRQAGTKLQIDGYNLLVIHDTVIVVISK